MIGIMKYRFDAYVKNESLRPYYEDLGDPKLANAEIVDRILEILTLLRAPVARSSSMLRVFFSYHYENDICRVDQVRQRLLAWRHHAPSLQDGSLWERAATRDERRLKAMIDRALHTTAVTVVLIGAETADRKYVLYEIEKSVALGRGVVAVYIHQLRDAFGRTAPRGPNPLDKLRDPETTRPLSRLFETYDWVDDDGPSNLGHWIEAAVRLNPAGTCLERCLL